jgi:transcription-repair coupling factor (superfamily II helicase)
VSSFRGNAFSNPAGLIPWISARAGAVRLRPDHKLVVSGDMDVTRRIKVAKDILGNLSRLVGQAKAA